MIAVDTNILVYAHRRDSEFHHTAAEALRQLAAGDELWAIVWPCIHEFLSIVTHPRVYKPASTVDEALTQIEAWRESPSLRLLAEDAGYWDELAALVRQGKVTGPKIHDARIAAICMVHGVRELWTADRDFSRISGIKVRNPLIAN